MNPITKVVRIGNSQGIRIPKTLLEQANLGEEVELIVQENQLIVRALTRPRAGWASAFARMAEQGDDAPVGGEWPTPAWDEDEWEW